jgi:phage repressor protein C with HTH and peptisase S24 domain
MKERLIEFLAHLSMGQTKFEEKVGLSRGFVNNIGDSIREKNLRKIATIYPDLNINWLKTGEGNMLNENTPMKGRPEAVSMEQIIPLLPISAQGGTLNDFAISVKDRDCEKIISPIKGADFAITVSGESMAPEYPSGSKVLIKKINEKSFIEWGRCYVLDTCNGVVIKKLDAPVEEDPKWGLNYVTCVSVNPDPIYKSFRVPTADIYGYYRVLLLLTEK